MHAEHYQLTQITGVEICNLVSFKANAVVFVAVVGCFGGLRGVSCEEGVSEC